MITYCEPSTFGIIKAEVIIKENKYNLTKFHWIEAVEKFTKVSYNDMRSSTRHKKILEARQFAMWLIRRYCIISLKDLGKLFNRDHTTVINALVKVSNFYINEKETQKKIEQIKRIANEN